MLVSSIIDFFFPPHNDVRVVRGLSEEEVRDKLLLQHKPKPWIVTGFSYHTPFVRSLIRANKFHADNTAATLLGTCLTDIVLSVLEDHALDVAWRKPLLIPIPSSRTRAHQRGYNQVERIVEKALPFITSSVEYRPKLLTRDNRESQTRIPRKDRTKNVSQSFFIKHTPSSADEVRGAYCIIVDDVSETGATLADARRALVEAGAKDVVGIALAH